LQKTLLVSGEYVLKINVFLRLRFHGYSITFCFVPVFSFTTLLLGEELSDFNHKRDGGGSAAWNNNCVKNTWLFDRTGRPYCYTERRKTSRERGGGRQIRRQK
jgi:hypothetical protein